MAGFIIDKFKNSEMILTMNLVLAYEHPNNNVLFLKHHTVYQFLSEESKETMRSLLCESLLDYSVDNSVLGFMEYLSKRRSEDSYNSLVLEINDKLQEFLYDSFKRNVVNKNLIYFIRCYYRNDDSTYYSIYKETSLDSLANPSIDINVLMADAEIRRLCNFICDEEGMTLSDLERCSNAVFNNHQLAENVVTRFIALTAILIVHSDFCLHSTEPNHVAKFIKSNLREINKEVCDSCYLNV